MTRHVATTELKAKLSELLGDVERGETISITRHGKAIARIQPIGDAEQERRRQAVENLRALRAEFPNVRMTVAEILSARGEGRK